MGRLVIHQSDHSRRSECRTTARIHFVVKGVHPPVYVYGEKKHPSGWLQVFYLSRRAANFWIEFLGSKHSGKLNFLDVFFSTSCIGAWFNFWHLYDQPCLTRHNVFVLLLFPAYLKVFTFDLRLPFSTSVMVHFLVYRHIRAISVTMYTACLSQLEFGWNFIYPEDWID